MARDRGDGSLRKLPNGRWEGRINYRDAGGNRVYRQITGKTHAIAKEKLDKLVEKIDKEKEMIANPDYVPQSNYLFREWLEVWQAEILPHTVRPATLESYYRNIEKHIKPALGELYLRQIRSVDIQAMINKAQRKGKYMPWTLNKLKNIVSGAFTAAMAQSPPLVTANPCKGVKTPTIKQKPIRVLSEQEQLAFMEAIKGSRFETLFVFALATGMRRGEIVALTWDCVDLKKMQITVRRNVIRVMDAATGKTRLVEGEPKSDAGERKVPILPSLAPVLMAHRQEQEAVKKLAGSAWNDGNLVFCSTVGSWIEPRRIQSELDKVNEDGGLDKFGIHTFRHTYATRMLEKEVPPKVVSEILGHADVKTTIQIYSHVFDSTAHEQAAKLDGLFAGLTTEKESVSEPETHYPNFKGMNKKARNTAKKKAGRER